MASPNDSNAPQKHTNDPNAFPEFRIDQIKCYAKRWISTYPVIQIEQIALYRYYLETSERFAAEHGCKSPKYALDFVISGCTDIDLKSIGIGTFPTKDDDKGIDLGTFPKGDDDECTTALKEIELANESNHHPLFDLAFVGRVYNEKPDIDYYRNWTYNLRRPGDPLWRGLLKNEPHWILFGSEGEDDREKADEQNRDADNKQTLSVSDYIKQRRTDGEKDEIIAHELHDKKYGFKLTYANLAVELGLNKGLNNSQFDALKKRGMRACNKGKTMLAKIRK